MTTGNVWTHLKLSEVEFREQNPSDASEYSAGHRTIARGKKNLFQNFIVLMLRNHDVPQSHIYYISEKILGIEK